MEKTVRRTNTVQTVLSERSIFHFECILRWFWNDYDPEALTGNLMKMLEVYVKHEPDDVPQQQKADQIVRFVNDVIDLNDQIKAVLQFE